MTLDDVIFAIESGAEAVPMLRRYRENFQSAEAALAQLADDVPYDYRRKVFDLAAVMGVLPAVQAEYQKLCEERSVRVAKWEAEKAAKQEAVVAAEPDFQPGIVVQPRETVEKIVATMPVQNNEF